MSEPRTDWLVATSPRLQSLVIEASVTGSSQGVLSVDLRRRIDAEVARLVAEARADALRDAAAAVEGLQEPTYDGFSWASSEQTGWETHEVAALAAIRELGERP